MGIPYPHFPGQLKIGKGPLKVIYPEARNPQDIIIPEGIVVTVYFRLKGSDRAVIIALPG
jgi:hypothetical protein